ncbi:MAG: MBL fold metallo-hydrolase [bacterium]|nr:MBL fold metallo-hydrolase [bacterium]
MRLEVLGSSGTAPRAGNPASGYLVRSGETTIWMDAGPGTYMALLDRVDPEEIDAVLLSHMHADHCSDIFALFHGLKHVRKSDRSVPVIVPDGATDRVLGFLAGGPDHAILENLKFREAQPNESILVGDVTITMQAAHHSVPALVFRIESGGRTLGYTGDTGPSELVEEHLSAVDLLLAEASLQDRSDSYVFHMSARQAAEMAVRASVGHLVLTHLPASLDPEESRRQAAEVYGGPMSLAAPGQTYIIGETSEEEL